MRRVKYAYTASTSTTATIPKVALTMNIAKTQPTVPINGTAKGTSSSGRKLTSPRRFSISTTTLIMAYVIRKNIVISGAMATA